MFSVDHGLAVDIALCMVAKKPFRVYAIRLQSEIQKISAFTVGTLNNDGQIALVRVRIAFSYLSWFLAEQ